MIYVTGHILFIVIIPNITARINVQFTTFLADWIRALIHKIRVNGEEKLLHSREISSRSEGTSELILVR